MNVNKKIKEQREKLYLTDVEVSKRAELSIYEYGDIESYNDEIFTVTNLYQVKNLCNVLKFYFFDLFEKKCSFCEEGKSYNADYMLPRSELIKKRRIELGLTEEELGSKVGFFKEAIFDMEKDKDFLERWGIDNIVELSNAIDVPLQILLDIKCNKCGR